MQINNLKHISLIKKISLGIASLALVCPLLLSGANTITANASSNNRNHSRIVKLEKQHKYYSMEIFNINKELAKLTHNSKFKINRVSKKKAHESGGQWYKNHAYKMYIQNANSNKIFREGFNDGNADGGNDSLINRKSLNSKTYSTYKHGWIAGNVYCRSGNSYNDDTNDSIPGDLKMSPVSSYSSALNAWQKGLNYLKAHSHVNSIQNELDDDLSNDAWGNANI